MRFQRVGNLRFMTRVLGTALVPSVAFVGCNDVIGTENPKEEPKGGQPNVLLVVVDDMGFSDLSAYGGEISTPTIDSLAACGTRFTGFHTSSLSAPTRSMLLTGVDNHRNGLGVMPPLHADNQYQQPGYEGYVNDNCITLAEVLRDNGYYTCMSGKWHLGAIPGYRPVDRGFVNSFALMGGGAGHFTNSFPLSEDERPVTYYMEDSVRLRELPATFYSSRFYADKMIEYIQNSPEDKPFFGYLAFTAPHDPLHILDEWSGKYTGRYKDGYAAIARARFERQKSLGLFPDSLSYEDLQHQLPDWESLTSEQQMEQQRRMEIYAAMIEYVDHSLARVLAALKAEGKESTLVLFMSDNGANPAESSSYENMGNGQSTMSSYNNNLSNYGRHDSFVAMGESWARVSNTPYSYYKTVTAEGGICVPLIVSGLDVQKGRIDTENLLHVTDLYPTILEYAGVRRPETYKGAKLAPLYGKSIKSTLANGSAARNGSEALCFEMIECSAVLKGDWKALRLTPPYSDGTTWQLYNLDNDIAEKQNLAASYPEKLNELVNVWNGYAESVGYIKSDGTSALKRLGAELYYNIPDE